jgi:DNA topoisomerase-1
VGRVLALLLDQRSRWLFSVRGTRIDADEINARLAELSGAHLTAKDFRTWYGTATAFRYLRRHLPAGDDADRHVLAAIDETADVLRNTRAVARGHYVHPDVLDGYTSGDLERFVAGRRIRANRWLDVDERLLLGYLAVTLERRAPDLAGS